MSNEEQEYLSRIGPAILHHFDHLPVTVLDLSTINDQNIRSSEPGSVMQKIKEARSSMPGILYLPDIASWWNVIENATSMVIMSSIEKLDTNNSCQLFLLATANVPSYEKLPMDVQKIFPEKKTFTVEGPLKEEKYNFFSQVIIDKSLEPPRSQTGWYKNNFKKGGPAVFLPKVL